MKYKEIYWYENLPLTFRVVLYTTWSTPGCIVTANGRELLPDANGVYTIPAVSEHVVVNCEPINTGAGQHDVCKYCGKVHPNNVLGFMIAMIHKLFGFFKNLGR